MAMETCIKGIEEGSRRNQMGRILSSEQRRVNTDRRKHREPALISEFGNTKLLVDSGSHGYNIRKIIFNAGIKFYSFGRHIFVLDF